MACGDGDNGLGGRGDLQFGMDASQQISSGDVGQNVDCDDQAMELDLEDNPLPLPHGHPTDAPVAAATTPQGHFN